MNMSAGTLISLEEYLKTSYHPDREFRDGVVVERNLGKKAHSRMQRQLTRYVGNRARQWDIEVFPEMRIRVRGNWYPIPDVCVYPMPVSDDPVPSTPPLLWVEILSEDDRMIDVWQKAKDLVACGVPYVWIIDPITLDSQLMTASGELHSVPDKTLEIPGTPIVIPLVQVMEE
jgi:Uma2 family endonuclease